MASTSSAVLIHCTCNAQLSVSRPPPSAPPLADFVHHPLSSLLFCEECDAIRCDSCVACEISCYYCPNCLFEVPSASVRGEKNRCARNCFQCPQCTHTLSVVATDPEATIPLTSAAASVGEPPYYLSCSFCLWDSKEAGITFEKPTGLAVQLQKAEEPIPEIVEFDHLKDHLDPYIRRGLSQNAHPSSSKDAVSSNLGASTRFGSLFGLSGRSRGGGGGAADLKMAGAWDELDKYATLVPASVVRDTGDKSGKRVDRAEEDLKRMREMHSFEDVASLDKRWASSWNQPLSASDLRPLRTPLHSKRSKRCAECKHILIKPEQKSSSTRFKIKIVASHYLPAIEMYRRPPATIGSRLSAIAAGTAAGMRRGHSRDASSSTSAAPGADEEPLRPGRTYSYELTFINPLYEAIHVRLGVARPAALTEGQPPPFAVNIPTSQLHIGPFAEAWEYEADEFEKEEEDRLDEEDEDGASASPRKAGSGKRKGSGAPGIVFKKLNRTTVLMEVAVGRETVGPIRANMLVTYVYQADDGTEAPASPPKSPVKKSSAPIGSEKDQDHKSFSFWALINLGTVQPRAVESRRSLAASSSST